MNAEECKQQLIEYTQRLNPVLNPLGFDFEISECGVASAGPFAAGFYVNGGKKIGLIYRAIAGLGSVNYEQGQVAIAHDHLMRYLGKHDVSKLKYDKSKFLSYSKDEGSVIDALVYDIQNFELEFLKRSDEQFGKTLKEILRNTSTVSDNKVMNAIMIGIAVGGIIGFIFHSLGWGILMGFVIGLIGGIYLDLQKDKGIKGR